MSEEKLKLIFLFISFSRNEFWKINGLGIGFGYQPHSEQNICYKLYVISFVTSKNDETYIW